jgi:hypothetical protein
MAIVITHLGGELYSATLTSPHSGRRERTMSQPMTRDLLMGALRDRGCRPAEISDAFYEADPHWLIRP